MDFKRLIKEAYFSSSTPPTGRMVSLRQSGQEKLGKTATIPKASLAKVATTKLNSVVVLSFLRKSRSMVDI